jgi:hypothetical protein
MTTEISLSVNPRVTRRIFVVSCGLSVTAFVLLLSLFIYESAMLTMHVPEQRIVALIIFVDMYL